MKYPEEPLEPLDPDEPLVPEVPLSPLSPVTTNAKVTSSKLEKIGLPPDEAWFDDINYPPTCLIS